MGMGQLAQGVVTMRTVALTQEAFLTGSHQRPTTPEGDGASVKVTHPSTPAPPISLMTGLSALRSTTL